MKYSNYIGILAALLMLLASKFTWIYIPSINAVVTGFGSASVTKFGQPALMNLIIIPISILLFLIPRLWAKRINPFLGALNFAWAFRNVLLLSTCRNGECPVTHSWLYIYFAASFVLMIMTLLPDLKIKEKQ